MKLQRLTVIPAQAGHDRFEIHRGFPSRDRFLIFTVFAP